MAEKSSADHFTVGMLVKRIRPAKGEAADMGVGRVADVISTGEVVVTFPVGGTGVHWPEDLEIVDVPPGEASDSNP